MGLVILGILVLFLLEGSFTAIPKQFHRVKREFVWYLLIPSLFGLIASIMSRLPLASTIIFLFSTLLDVPLRFIVFLGLAHSFRAYFASKEKNYGALGLIAAWVACLYQLLGFVLMLAAIGWLVLHGKESPPDWVIFFGDARMVWLGYALLLGAYLITMGSYRNRVLDIERQLRRKTVQEVTAAAKTKTASRAYQGEGGEGGVG